MAAHAQTVPPLLPAVEGDATERLSTERLSVETRLAAPDPGRLSLRTVVDRTLRDGPDIEVQREMLSRSDGLWQAARAPFDPTLQASISRTRQDRPTVVDGDRILRLRTNQVTYRLGLSKRYRFGLQATPNVEVRRTDAITEGLSPYVSAAVGMDVSMPLLEGRGAEVQASEERAAAAAYQSATAQTKHTLARSVLTSTLLYWEYRAATERLDILRESERRAQRFVTETERLVEADERPAADLKQLSANLADRRAARIAGEQAVFETRQRLGVAMGLTPDQIQRLPPPADPFPGDGMSADSLRVLGSAEAMSGLASGVTERRWDLEAARRSQEASERLLDGLRSTRQPNLTLDVHVGYVGLKRGSAFTPYLHAFDTNVGGANLTLALRYKWPLRNSGAAGEIAAQKARASQRLIQERNLERDIRSQLRVSLHALHRSSAELLASREATRLYTTAVDNERKKLRLDLSTELNLLLIEDRLTDALLARIDAQRRHARALVTLRFESGQLLPANSSLRPRVDARRLTTMPDLDREH